MRSDEEPGEGHAGEQLRQLRVQAGMSIEGVAQRAGVGAGWLRKLEEGVGMSSVLYHEWVNLVRATQPLRPEWWDEGHEHDLALGEGGVVSVRSEGERAYWARVEG